LRHPIERLPSEYRHDATIAGVRGPIDRVVVEEERFLSKSMYAFQIDLYLEHFVRGRLLVLTFEELRDEPVAYGAVAERLRSDLRHLRDHLGQDFHCWGLLG
jgi:hypothetical protein